jgi:hypothetical protein
MEFLQGIAEFFTLTIPAIVREPAPVGFWRELGKAAGFGISLVVIVPVVFILTLLVKRMFGR